MKLKTLNVLKTVLCICCLFAAVLFAASLIAGNAFAEVSVKNVDTGISFNNGASVRIDTDDDALSKKVTGIRFIAHISEDLREKLVNTDNSGFKDGAELGVMFAPKTAFDKFDEQAESSAFDDYFEFFENFGKAKKDISATIPFNKVVKTSEDYEISCVVDLSEENYPRDYQAVLYYRTSESGEYVYSARSVSRNIVYVATETFKDPRGLSQKQIDAIEAFLKRYGEPTADALIVPEGFEIEECLNSSFDANAGKTGTITISSLKAFKYLLNTLDMNLAFERCSKDEWAHTCIWYGGAHARHIKLATDIDFEGETIDNGFVNLKDFDFDGQGHEIKNLNIRHDGDDNTGLFVGRNHGVSNVVLDNVHVTVTNGATNCAGILCSDANADIYGVTIRNSSVKGGKYTGAVVGYNYGGANDCTVENCTVSGRYKVGGIVGYVCSSSDDVVTKVSGNKLSNVAVVAEDKLKDVAYIGTIVGNWNAPKGECLGNDFNGSENNEAVNVIGKLEDERCEVAVEKVQGEDYLGKQTFTTTYYYTVASANDIIVFANKVTETPSAFPDTIRYEAVFISDIDMKGVAWTPVNMVAGNSVHVTMDGSNRVISNLTVQDVQHAGLFDTVGSTEVNSSMKIKNLTIKDSAFSTPATNPVAEREYNEAGAFQAHGGKCDYENCKVVNCVIKTSKYGGGFIGYDSCGNGYSLTDCEVRETTVLSLETDATKSVSVGGFIGYTQTPVTFYRCNASENTVTGKYAGSYFGTLNHKNCCLESCKISDTFIPLDGSVTGLYGRVGDAGYTLTLR